MRIIRSVRVNGKFAWPGLLRQLLPSRDHLCYSGLDLVVVIFKCRSVAAPSHDRLCLESAVLCSSDRGR